MKSDKEKHEDQLMRDLFAATGVSPEPFEETAYPFKNEITMTTKLEHGKYVVYMEKYALGTFDTEEQAEGFTIVIAENITGGKWIPHNKKNKEKL